MLLPNKHTKLSESVLGLGARLLDSLVIPKTVDELVAQVRGTHSSGLYPEKHSFDNVVLALGFLYSLGVIKIDAYGRICRATH